MKDLPGTVSFPDKSFFVMDNDALSKTFNYLSILNKESLSIDNEIIEKNDNNNLKRNIYG